MLYQPVAPTGKRVCPAPNTAPVSGLLVMRDKVSYTTITCSPLLAFVGLRVRVVFQQWHSKLPCTLGLLHLVHHLRWDGVCFLPNSSCAPMRFCHVLPSFPVSAAVGSL